jgi:hypothetical protein
MLFVLLFSFQLSLSGHWVDLRIGTFAGIGNDAIVLAINLLVPFRLQPPVDSKAGTTQPDTLLAYIGTSAKDFSPAPGKTPANCPRHVFCSRFRRPAALGFAPIRDKIGGSSCSTADPGLACPRENSNQTAARKIVREHA